MLCLGLKLKRGWGGDADSETGISSINKGRRGSKKSASDEEGRVRGWEDGSAEKVPPRVDEFRALHLCQTHMWSHTSATVELLVGRDGRSQLSGKPVWPIDETVDEREDGELGWEPGDGDEVAQKNHTLICPLTR